VTSASHAAPARQDNAFLAWCAGAAAFTFVLQLWWCQSLIRGYYPTGSELAVEVTSTPIGGAVKPWSWFTDGFHYYFQNYPEWLVAQSDFCRPLANALFWLNYRLFGTAWGSQLVFGYLMHAAMVGLTGYVAWRVFRLNRWLALTAMLIAVLNPGYWSANDTYNSLSYNSAPELLQYPVFQTEIFCALLMMLAFIAFVANRYLLFCALATVALLLKETSLTVPIAAIVLVGAWWRSNPGRTLANLGWLVLPLALWYLGRALVFAHGHSFYVLASGSRWGWLLKPIRNLLYLPSTLYRGPLAVTRNAIVAHEPRTLLIHGFQLAANIAWWWAVFYALVRAWRQAAGHWFSSPPAPWICGLVFALGNVGLVMLLQVPDARFTYFWFDLGPAAIFAALAHRRHALAIALALGLCLAVPQLFAMQRAVSADSIRNYQLVKRSGVALMQLLGKLPPTVANVYLVDDLVAQATAPAFLARFAGFRGRVILVNSINPILGCKPGAAPAARYHLRRDASGTQLDYRAPDCFYALNEAPLDMFDDHNEVQRGTWMRYRYPQLKLAGASADVVGAAGYDPGSQWSVTVTDPACVAAGACVWLGLDPVQQAYYVLSE
jgi:hypothetical protein